MAESVLGMIGQLGREVEAVAGESVRQKVMAGTESLTSKTKPEEIALWVRGAIDRLDTLAAEDARARAMDNCGVNCARVNGAVIQRGKARRAKHATEESFLAAEVRKPSTGTRLERDGDILYQIYTPAAFSHPMRCFCGLLRGLPEGAQVSPTYCLCSRAFVRTYWSEVLDHQVEVDVLETAITGSTQCRFKITLRGGMTVGRPLSPRLPMGLMGAPTTEYPWWHTRLTIERNLDAPVKPRRGTMNP